MSTVQKIFVVVIFALAVLFTGLSIYMLSVEQHWKDQYNETREELNTTQQELGEEIKQLEASVDTKEQELADLQTENRFLEEKKEGLGNQITQLETDIDKARSNANTLSSNNSVLAKQNEDYKEKLNEMTEKYQSTKKRAEEMVKLYQFKQDELADVIAELNDIKSRNRTLQVKYKKAEEQNQAYTVVLEQLKKRYGIDALETLRKPAMPETPIEARVVAVAKDKESGNMRLVMLSVGKQDGVKKGYNFVIYRDETYVGKVIVDKVFDDMSTATVQPDSLARDDEGNTMTIQQYDNASTQVY